MGIDRSHNRGLLQQTPSCLTRLESGAHYSQEYGRVFNSLTENGTRPYWHERDTGQCLSELAVICVYLSYACLL